MAFLNDVGNSVVDAATGSSSGTNLNSFLRKFYSSKGNFVDVLDPKSTFDVSFKFYPTIKSGSDTNKAEAVLNALGTAATGALTNLGNNLTGGLLNSIMNSSVSIIDEHNKFTTEDSKGSHTFLEYLAKANMLVGGENWFNPSSQKTAPLELQFGPYIQSVTIPQLNMPSEGKSITSIGEFPVNGTYIKPDNNQLQLEILNTKAALHERIFYPWMREVTLNYWSYNEQPYTTATITINFQKHNDVQYVFCGCRPSQIVMLQGNQDTSNADNLKRQVTFIFDYMFVTSKLDVVESVKDKLLSTGKALVNSAAHTLNF